MLSIIDGFLNWLIPVSYKIEQASVCAYGALTLLGAGEALWMIFRP